MGTQRVRHFPERLARLGRLIIFDKRGTGLSDRTLAAASLEDHVSDLRQVLQSVGSLRPAIAAWGDGAAIALMFAATTPEQVGALVLGGLALEARRSQGASFVPDPNMLEVMSAAVEADWGKGTFGQLMAPSVAADERFLSWYRKYERVSATPNAAAAALRWMLEIDVTPILAAVQAPTLVLHRAGSPWPTDPVRALAGRVTNGTFVELPGDDAMPFVGDSDSYLGEIEEFLTGWRRRPDGDRCLATVLFTDIVASTQTAHRLGDRRWRHLLEEHYAVVRPLLDRFKGVEVATTGDGFVATFDGPGRAIRCACAIRDAVRALGLEVRGGPARGRSRAARHRHLRSDRSHRCARSKHGEGERSPRDQHCASAGHGFGDQVRGPRHPRSQRCTRSLATARRRDGLTTRSPPAGACSEPRRRRCEVERVQRRGHQGSRQCCRHCRRNRRPAGCSPARLTRPPMLDLSDATPRAALSH